MIQFNKKTSSILAVVILVLLVPVVYFFAWRPADQDYASALDSLDDSKTSVATIDATLDSVHNPSDMTSEVAERLEQAVTTYTKSMDSLAKNAAMSRDLVVAPAYAAHKDTLATYSTSAANLLASLKLYHSILNTCTHLIDKIGDIPNTKTFDTEAKPCGASIDAAKKAPAGVLNDKFLKNYVPLSEKLLQEYRKLLVVADQGTAEISFSGIADTANKIVALDKSNLSLKLTQAPTSTITQLTDTLNKQRGALVR